MNYVLAARSGTQAYQAPGCYKSVNSHRIWAIQHNLVMEQVKPEKNLRSKNVTDYHVFAVKRNPPTKPAWELVYPNSRAN